MKKQIVFLPIPAVLLAASMSATELLNESFDSTADWTVDSGTSYSDSVDRFFTDGPTLNPNATVADPAPNLTQFNDTSMSTTVAGGTTQDAVSALA